jgi:hypothetical protein
MKETGRENKEENDVFFVCSVIEYIGRKTKNRRSVVVEKLGKAEITRLFELADIFHCEPIEHTAQDLIEKCSITDGNFDNLASCKYNVPTHFDIAKVYKRLICALAPSKNNKPLTALTEVYSSWISPKIDDYNSSMYFENPEYLFESYKAGEPIS